MLKLLSGLNLIHQSHDLFHKSFTDFFFNRISDNPSVTQKEVTFYEMVENSNAVKISVERVWHIHRRKLSPKLVPCLAHSRSQTVSYGLVWAMFGYAPAECKGIFAMLDYCWWNVNSKLKITNKKFKKNLYRKSKDGSISVHRLSTERQKVLERLNLANEKYKILL